MSTTLGAVGRLFLIYIFCITIIKSYKPKYGQERGGTSHTNSWMQSHWLHYTFTKGRNVDKSSLQDELFNMIKLPKEDKH